MSRKKTAYPNHFPTIQLTAFVCILSAFVLFLNTTAIAKNRNAIDPQKYAAFVMHADTGLILHQYNANKSLHPASLTKMMTLLLLFDAIDHGALRLNDKVQISRHAANMVPSKIGLNPGEHILVRDAINALSIKSANDIAVAVAEKLGGSEKKFAEMMTQKARNLGMKRTRFKNASGLHDPNQVSTARDMATLSQALITRYKHHYHYFSQDSFTYQGKTYRSHNKLMKTYTGMDGLKTGYISASGFNLAASAVRDGHRIIGVVFGGKTAKSRNAQMEMLLDNAFERLEGSTLIARNQAPYPHKKPSPYIENAAFEEELPNIQTGGTPPTTSRWSMLSTLYDQSMFNRMIGQGDYDITVRNRIETGLIAISAQLNEGIPQHVWNENAPLKTEEQNNTPEHIKIPQNDNILKNPRSGDWAIQIGAFTTRKRSDRAISISMDKLPGYLKNGQTNVAPVQTEQGWIYRARILGYSKQAANDACRILSDCIPLSPEFLD